VQRQSHMARKKQAPDVLEAVGRRVAQARKSVGLTQEELAIKAGVSHGTVSKIEGGKQWPTDALEGLCAALGRTADWLLFEIEDRRPHAVLGAELRRAREVAGFVLARVAAALGVPTDSVVQWEQGYERPPDGVIAKIAAVLGLDGDQLLEPHTWGNLGGDVTNEDIKVLLDRAGMAAPPERYEFARFAARFSLNELQAARVLEAIGRPLRKEAAQARR
jgi:transcriptional regulator with XRE-family HTH domain